MLCFSSRALPRPKNVVLNIIASLRCHWPLLSCLRRLASKSNPSSSQPGLPMTCGGVSVSLRILSASPGETGVHRKHNQGRPMCTDCKHRKKTVFSCFLSIVCLFLVFVVVVVLLHTVDAVVTSTLFLVICWMTKSICFLCFFPACPHSEGWVLVESMLSSWCSLSFPVQQIGYKCSIYKALSALTYKQIIRFQSDYSLYSN